MGSGEPVRLIIKVGIDESMPEPPSIFYTEQKRVKQKLSSLKAEKQQLQKELSSLQESRQEYDAELLQCPQLLSEARSQISLLEQKQHEAADGLMQSKQADKELRDQLQQSQTSCDTLTNSLTEVQQACAKASAEAAASITQLGAAAVESDGLAQQLASQQQSARSVEQKCEELQSQLQQSQDRTNALEQQLQDLPQAQMDAPESEPGTQQQLKTGDLDRDTLQLQVSSLQEALAKAQRLSTPPSPTGLTPPSGSQTPSPLKDEFALHGLKAVRAVLSSQLTNLQQAVEVDEQAVQDLQSAQLHAQELEDKIMAWQASSSWYCLDWQLGLQEHGIICANTCQCLQDTKHLCTPARSGLTVRASCHPVLCCV